MSTVSYPAEQRVVLENIPWTTYLSIINDAQNRRGRIAYDNGVMEIMSPSRMHENVKKLIGRMVEALTEELNIAIDSTSSTTLKREDLKKGVEGDESYYIQNSEAIRDKDEIDAAIDPGPDLMIEVDISRSSMSKFRIYAAMGIAEVWRCDGEQIRIHCLRKDEYQEVNESEVLPQFPMTQAMEVLKRRPSTNETQLIREFRAWVRENVTQQ